MKLANILRAAILPAALIASTAIPSLAQNRVDRPRVTLTTEHSDGHRWLPQRTQTPRRGIERAGLTVYYNPRDNTTRYNYGVAPAGRTHGIHEPTSIAIMHDGIVTTQELANRDITIYSIGCTSVQGQCDSTAVRYVPAAPTVQRRTGEQKKPVEQRPPRDSIRSDRRIPQDTTPPDRRARRDSTPSERRTPEDTAHTEPNATRHTPHYNGEHPHILLGTDLSAFGRQYVNNHLGGTGQNNTQSNLGQNFYANALVPFGRKHNGIRPALFTISYNTINGSRWLTSDDFQNIKTNYTNVTTTGDLQVNVRNNFGLRTGIERTNGTSKSLNLDSPEDTIVAEGRQSVPYGGIYFGDIADKLSATIAFRNSPQAPRQVRNTWELRLAAEHNAQLTNDDNLSWLLEMRGAVGGKMPTAGREIDVQLLGHGQYAIPGLKGFGVEGEARIAYADGTMRRLTGTARFGVTYTR